MTGRAFDAAYKPNLDAIVAAGGQIMTVYLTGIYAVDGAWCLQIHAKGLGILGNYEEGVDELVHCGRAGGVTIGQRAAAAYIADGAPANVGLAIVFSVDVNVQPYLFSQVGAAFNGIIAGLAGRFTAKVYGEGALIDYLVANHEVTRLDWLSASSSFPGFNPADPNVAMVQQVGSPVAGTDLDVITQPIDGVWWPNGMDAPAVVGATQLQPAQPEDDMYEIVQLFKRPDAKTIIGYGLVDGTGRKVHLSGPWFDSLATLRTAKAQATGVPAPKYPTMWTDDFDNLPNIPGDPAAALGGVTQSEAVLAGQITGLQAAISHITAGQPIDMAAVTQAAHDGAVAALAGAVITVTPKGA